jgi:hypothetical protein
MNLTEIKFFNVMPGTSIDEAASEALDIAESYNCIVKFEFNSASIEVSKFYSIEEIVKQYYRKIRSNA